MIYCQDPLVDQRRLSMQKLGASVESMAALNPTRAVGIQGRAVRDMQRGPDQPEGENISR